MSKVGLASYRMQCTRWGRTQSCWGSWSVPILLEEEARIGSRLKAVHLPAFNCSTVPDICVLLLFPTSFCHIYYFGKLIWTLDALCSQVLQKNQLDYFGMNCIFSIIYYMFPFNSKIGELYVSGINSGLAFQFEFLLCKNEATLTPGSQLKCHRKFLTDV